MAANSELLQLQSTLDLTTEQEDRAFAALYEVSLNQLTGSTKPATTNQAEAMQWASRPENQGAGARPDAHPVGKLPPTAGHPGQAIKDNYSKMTQ